MHNSVCVICGKEVNWLISIINIHLCGECYFKYGDRLADAISQSLLSEIRKIKSDRACLKKRFKETK